MNGLRLALAAVLGVLAFAWLLGAEDDLQRYAGATVFLAWALVALRPEVLRGRWLEALALTGLLAAPLGPGFLAAGGLLAAPVAARSGIRAWRRLQLFVRGGNP